jgi:hypothetical protein
VTKRFEKNHPNFQKEAKTVAKQKKSQNFYIKAQFEGPTHLHQITF